MPILFRYANGDDVRLGDRVRRRRWFRAPLVGVVAWMHDPTKPAPPRGDNDMGYSIRWDDPRAGGYWGSTTPDPRLELIERGAAPD